MKIYLIFLTLFLTNINSIICDEVELSNIETILENRKIHIDENIKTLNAYTIFSIINERIRDTGWKIEVDKSTTYIEQSDLNWFLEYLKNDIWTLDNSISKKEIISEINSLSIYDLMQYMGGFYGSHVYIIQEEYILLYTFASSSGSIIRIDNANNNPVMKNMRKP